MVIERIHNKIYSVRFSDKIIIVKDARYVLRRAGKCLGRWLKYLVGLIVETGEKIKVCLGEARGDDVDIWVISGNGSVTRLAYRMVEFMLEYLGADRVVEIAKQYV